MSWIDVATQRIIELEGFIPEAKRVFKDEDNFTIGYGKNDSSVKAGQKISQSEAAKDLKLNLIPQKIKVAKRLFPNFDNFSDNLKVELLQGVFRGDFKSGHKTVKHINKGDFNKASTEFLNNKEYRDAQLPDSGKAGIVPRMESISLALNNEGTGMEIKTTPKARPESITISPEAMPQEVPQPKSFNQAFSEARQQQGSGGTFEWNGNSYSTNMAGEVPAVAEPQFPAQELLPAVPSRTPSVSSDRSGISDFKGLEIPPVGFNEGTNSVPGFLELLKGVFVNPQRVENERNMQERAIMNSVLDREIANSAPPSLNKDKIITTKLNPPPMESDINQDQRNLQEMAIMNDVKNNYSIPQVNSNDDIIQTTLPELNNAMNFASNTVNSLDNRTNVPMTQKQIDTRANMYSKSVADGSYGDPQAGYGEPLNKDISYHQSIYGPGVPQLGDEKALREKEEYIQNLKIPVIKDKVKKESIVTKEDNTLSSTPNTEESKMRVANLNNEKIDLDDDENKKLFDFTPKEVKEKVGSLLQTFFGLETADLGRAIGFYLASRATGASHEGSMRWAGTTVLKQAESNKILNSKKADATLTAFSKVRGNYTPEAGSKITKLLTEGKLVEAQALMARPDSKTTRGKLGIDANAAGDFYMIPGYTTAIEIFEGAGGNRYTKVVTEKDGKKVETYKPISSAEMGQLRKRGDQDDDTSRLSAVRAYVEQMPAALFKREGIDKENNVYREAGIFSGRSQEGVTADIMAYARKQRELGLRDDPIDIMQMVGRGAELAESMGITKINAETIIDMQVVGGDTLFDQDKISKDGELVAPSKIKSFTSDFQDILGNDRDLITTTMNTAASQFTPEMTIDTIKAVPLYSELDDSQKAKVDSAPSTFMALSLLTAYANKPQ